VTLSSLRHAPSRGSGPLAGHFLAVPAVALVVAPLLLLLHPASTANPSRPAAVIAVAKLRFICCTTSFRSMTPRDRATGAGCVA
jgi:hypothetical protein